MKTTYNGFLIEGTVSEIKEFVSNKSLVVIEKKTPTRHRGSSPDAPINKKILKCLKEHNEYLTAKQISALSGVKNVNQRMGDLLKLNLVQRRKNKFFEYHFVEKHDLQALNGVIFKTNTELRGEQ